MYIWRAYAAHDYVSKSGRERCLPFSLSRTRRLDPDARRGYIVSPRKDFLVGCSAETRTRNSRIKVWCVTITPRGSKKSTECYLILIRHRYRCCSFYRSTHTLRTRPIRIHPLVSDTCGMHGVIFRIMPMKNVTASLYLVGKKPLQAPVIVVFPEGVEPPASWFVARRSIQLGYGKQNHRNNS